MLNATVGDHIEVESAKTGSSRRNGEVTEVIGSGDALHYRVRWDDGHESLFFPGPDTHLTRTDQARH